MRIGIIGTGSMGETHVEAWAHTPAKIVGIASRRFENALRLAERCNAVAFDSIEAMLPYVDVIDICTPTPLHLAHTRLAVQAGRHVVCEKPLARSVADAQAIIDVCAAAHVKLLVAHVVRYFDAYADAHARVSRGEAGALKLLRLSRLGSMVTLDGASWFNDMDATGGVMFDLMIHDFDYARWVAGDVVSVRAINANAWGRETTQHAAVLLTHASGAVSHVEGSWAMPPNTFRTSFDLIGDTGRIEYTSAPASDPLASATGGANPYVTQAQAFYDTLANDAPTRVTAQDALEAVRIALAAIESTRTGQVIML